jgi:hypothetical protein
MYLGFHKIRGSSWLAQNRVASQKGPCSMDLVSKNINSVLDANFVHRSGQKF